MKKLLLLFTLCTSHYFSIAQRSILVFNISDTTEEKLVDKIEYKLLKHLNEIEKHKIPSNINLYDINGSSYRCYDLSETVEHTIPQNKVKTYKYELDIKWSKNLDSIYVMSFSREYYHPRPKWDGYHSIDSIDVSCTPIYEIPIIQYSRFLTTSEMNSMYSLIKTEFIKSINDDSIKAYKENESRRSFSLIKGDSLVQMPWTVWLNSILWAGRKKIPIYGDKDFQNKLRKWSADSNRLNVKTIIDSSGNCCTVGWPMDFKSVIISEAWNFDTTIRHDFCGMAVTHKVNSIELPVFPDPTADNKANHFPMWVKDEDIESLCKSEGGYLYLYKDLINSALYRKLNLKY